MLASQLIRAKRIAYDGGPGTVAVLNIGEGDIKLTFDKDNPAECIRAARVVKDMLRRGYALLVEVSVDGEKKFMRAKDFDEAVCEYVIAAGPDAYEAVPLPDGDANAPKTKTKTPKTKAKTTQRRVPAETTRAVAVGRTAGG